MVLFSVALSSWPAANHIQCFVAELRHLTDMPYATKVNERVVHRVSDEFSKEFFVGKCIGGVPN